MKESRMMRKGTAVRNHSREGGCCGRGETVDPAIALTPQHS